MALSGSRNFSMTRDEIIDQALDLVGGLNQGTATLAEERDRAATKLNYVVQSLSARGVLHLWEWVRRTDLYVANVVQNVVTSGTSTYDLGTDVLDVMVGTVFVRRSSIDSPLLPMSYDEYALEGSKTASGKPTRFLLERNQEYTDSSSGRGIPGRFRIVLHPVPNNSTDVIGYTCMKKAQDYDAGSNDAGSPPVWSRCLIYGLASELAVKYGLDIAERRDIRAEFEKELEQLRRHDTQRGRMMLTPRF